MIIIFFLFILRLVLWIYNRVSFTIKDIDNNYIDIKKKIKLLIVLGSGGHTTEILMLLKDMDLKNKVSLDCIIADTDKFSEEKAIKALSEYLNVDQNLVNNYVTFFKIKRSREVHQSYVTSIFTTLISFIQSLKILYKHNYDLLLINGPGTCIPVCFGALLLEFILLRKFKLVFVESFCRTRTLSLSGKLLLPFVDKFIVLWPYLSEKYSKCEYLGVLF